MASSTEPPPKKRRTDSVQVTDESVAQANSTLQIFLGQNQRQNRWMQGYASQAIQPQANGAASRAVNGGPHRVQPRKNTAPMAQASPTSRPHESNIVQYDSPATSSTLSSNAPPVAVYTKSVDRVPSGGAPPGLPSPVSSDGNMNSPANTHEAAAPRRGRPPIHAADPGRPTNGSPATRMQPQFLPPPHGHVLQSTPNTSRVNNFNPAQHAQNVQSPRRQQQSLPQSLWDSRVMLQKLNLFERTILPKLGAQPVDIGRLHLLREAIEKNDIFYICLSQIHCLTLTPALLPEAAKKLSMQAIAYMDILICANHTVNQTVLKWLSDFPAPITNIYASHSRTTYNKYVQDVTEFLTRMPVHWDSLVSECKKRGTPPLMDDLITKLALFSPVLQTTVFRAISRMIISDPGDALEHLHRLDQIAFSQGGRNNRSNAEKEAAYGAFRETIGQLCEHEQAYKNTSPSNRPRFLLQTGALAVFQARVIVPPSPQAQNVNPGHQHPTIDVNNQGMVHLRHMSTGRSGSPRQATAQNQEPPHLLANSYIPMPRQQHKPSRQLVFPHETEQPRAQPTHPDTMRSGLHQAHLRSPILTPSKPDEPRLYRYVSQFVACPRKINKDLFAETMSFNVSHELYDSLPVTVVSNRTGEPRARMLKETSHTVRLRCAQATSKSLISDTAWMEADNCWPDNLYLTCNSHVLEPRRKLHHGRYLPLDITGVIQPGDNELQVVVNRMSTDNRPFDWALAIEVVGVINHNTIFDNLTHISAKDSLGSIKASLSAPDGDEDDVMITSSTTTIQLFDPHTLTKIFDVPVRGAACLHKDCFDLETFLSQRDPKTTLNVPSVVDCWRCPICRGDVRPHTLVRDGFLDSVREELKLKGMLDTRAIVVEPDGKWKPKEEERDGVRSPSLEREERSSSAVNSAKKEFLPAVHISRPKPAIEIIEIDDD